MEGYFYGPKISNTNLKLFLYIFFYVEWYAVVFQWIKYRQNIDINAIVCFQCVFMDGLMKERGDKSARRTRTSASALCIQSTMMGEGEGRRKMDGERMIAGLIEPPVCPRMLSHVWGRLGGSDWQGRWKFPSSASSRLDTRSEVWCLLDDHRSSLARY